MYRCRVKYQDNSAIRGARIKLFNNRGVYFCETNENGMYLINNIKFSNKNKLIVSVYGFPDQENEEIVFSEGDNLQNINFVFIRGGKTFCGRVIDSITKKGVFPVALILVNSDGTPKQINSSCDENGNFCFNNLVSGKYELGMMSTLFKEKIITYDLLFTESVNKIYEVETVSFE